MSKPVPVNEEYIFTDGVIISETDTNGVITFANRKFCEISGYKKEELVGQPHSIVRHPDMPKAAFKDMWETIKNGKNWEGLIKNLRKDGKYYWVMSYIKPKYDENGNIIGYIAARRVPTRPEIRRYEILYKEMKSKEE
ncbi:PAS domain-containing protein [Nitrosophilus alvini]|uniref:PAS domain-containing protein n=1 Tax=Nitrosophilus alvini TaxID=2714855 RepID=UPI00190D4488|nr:PAS domain-containing protein [Nitrosophilus alvini]